MMTDTRTRGITITPLDLDPYLPDALETAQKANPDAGWTLARYNMRYALAVAPDGTQYVVCSEGVGWTLDEPIQVDVYCTADDKHIAIFPSVALTLDAEEVAKTATCEPVDLADFVRTFGGRLESNFWVWYDILTGKTVK